MRDRGVLYRSIDITLDLNEHPGKQMINLYSVSESAAYQCSGTMMLSEDAVVMRGMSPAKNSHAVLLKSGPTVNLDIDLQSTN